MSEIAIDMTLLTTYRHCALAIRLPYPAHVVKKVNDLALQVWIQCSLLCRQAERVVQDAVPKMQMARGRY